MKTKFAASLALAFSAAIIPAAAQQDASCNVPGCASSASTARGATSQELSAFTTKPGDASLKSAFGSQSAPSLDPRREQSPLMGAMPAGVQDSGGSSFGVKSTSPSLSLGVSGQPGVASSFAQFSSGMDGFSVNSEPRPAKASEQQTGSQQGSVSTGMTPMLGVDVSSGGSFGVKSSATKP